MASSGARGKSGRAAVEAIVRNFERPANPGAEIQKALGHYGKSNGTSWDPTPAPTQSQADSSVNPKQALALALIQANQQTGQGRQPDYTNVFSALRMSQASPAVPNTPMPTAPGGPGITYNGQRLTHDTDGLPGFPAVDLFARPGTPFVAPENGKIVRKSGHPGTTSGQVFGESVYFQGQSGRLYFVTHLGTSAPIGSYRRGQPIGTVSQWSGGKPHAHVGIRS